MQTTGLENRNIVIWGLGREAMAAAAYFRRAVPDCPLIFVDESEKAGDEKIPPNATIIRGESNIAAALDKADIVVKSPGVSLYHPLVQRAKQRGVSVTSLLNLWLRRAHDARTIGVTGTKGKSTTSSLLAHVLQKLDHQTALGGNIGVPITEIFGNAFEYVVIEVSSYQAADLSEPLDLAILTSLQPEHLDWHGSVERYYADKLNLLRHARLRIVGLDVLPLALNHGLTDKQLLLFNDPSGMHVKDGAIYDGLKKLGAPDNRHLSRPHNLSNACAVLTAIKHYGLDGASALAAMADYKPLPHRQQELGEKNGVLYVNDSIATTPHAAIAALEFYRDRSITLIAGGFDRGINYDPLVDYVLSHKLCAVILMGPSGQRIHAALTAQRKERIFTAGSMDEVIALARAHTPAGGVVLLSPAAPSYGLFKDFTERGNSFAKAAGFPSEK